jgi:hypothetical protein
MPKHLKNDAGVMCNVVKYTTTCSGCSCEIMQWDEKAQCALGMGCFECGYTGKRRMTMYIPLNEAI